MNPGDALDLRDIHLPAEPGWWPPAPGWWLLMVLALILLFFLGRAALRARRRRRRLLAVEREWNALLERHPESDVQRLAALSELARRLCRRYAPEQLSLTDEAWLRFLDGESQDRFFSEGAGRLMLGGAYRRSVDAEAVEAIAAPLRSRLRQLVETADA